MDSQNQIKMESVLDSQGNNWLNEDLNSKLQTVVAALECVMNASSTNDARMAAYKVCEEFRENCPLYEIGFQISQKENSDVVRHFGLQSVEHWIKYRWNEVTDERKVYLKKVSLEFLHQGTKDILCECRHTKDAVTRIVVELMKRLWPQLWEDLFQEFTRISEQGMTQTELVLMVLLRLSEDVVGFQNVPSPRCKDLRQSMSRIMDSIVTFVLQILNKHLAIYRGQLDEDRERALQVCYTVLETLSGFVEWISITHIADTALLPQICSLLLDDDHGICLRASECLLLIVGRRGKLDERKPLMVLFSKEAMSLLLQAATNATEHINTTDHTGFYLLFLKRLCEILLEMGKQLCALWGSDHCQEPPENFDLYLKAVLAFMQHPCQSLRDMIVPLWILFIRHVRVSKDDHFLSIIPDLIQCFTVCLLKVGFPSQHNSVSCDYSRLEYDRDDEFNELLAHLRSNVIDQIRALTLQQPRMTFEAGMSWLRGLLDKPIETGSESRVCDQNSPSLIAWDGCSVFLDAVMCKLFMADAEMPKIQDGVELLHKVLAYETQDPLILSNVLTCLSSLFMFLTYTPQSLPRVIARIKAAAVFSLPGQTRSTRSQSVINVRVHACAILIKLCKNHTDLMLPEFQNLYEGVKELDRETECPSQMEKVILTEALIIVSNQFLNFARQSIFIEEIMQPVKELWSSEDFLTAFSTPELFMKYVGLDQAAVEPSSADTCGINRSHIKYCLSTILAVIKRCRWPEDYAKAERGGFVVQGYNCGNILRNPAFPHVIVTFDNVIALLKTACHLFKAESLQLRHTDFSKSYQLPDKEIMNLLGIQVPAGDKEDAAVAYKRPLNRMQFFTMNLFEEIFAILGNAAACFGMEFYSTPTLEKILIENVFNNISLLPDDRMRSMISKFLKLLLTHCPKERYEDFAIPILKVVCPQMFERLVNSWKILNQKAEERSQNDEEEASDTQELLEEYLIRTLTKDYLEFLNLSLFGKNMTTEVKEESAMEESNISAGGKPNNNLDCTAVLILSDLGHKIMEMSDLYPNFIMCIITGLSWADTTVCLKCAAMLWPLCKKLADRSELTADAAKFTFMAVLSGLSLHGMHDPVNVVLTQLALIIYETLRKDFVVLTAVLEQIPNVDKQTILEFEEKYLAPDGCQIVKKKKDAFKKIVANIVGKHVGQKFRRTAQYSKLPLLFLQTRKQRQVRCDEVGVGGDLGLTELFATT